MFGTEMTVSPRHLSVSADPDPDMRSIPTNAGVVQDALKHALAATMDYPPCTQEQDA